MLFQDTVFWLLAVIAIGSALGVVLIRDLFRAALLLVLVFVAIAGFFVLLSAEFLAVVQVLIYAGAISILLIFGIMLTRNVQQGNLANRLQLPAVVFSVMLLAVMVTVALQTDWSTLTEGQEEVANVVQTSAVKTLSAENGVPSLDLPDITAAQHESLKSAGLADLLVSDFVLPFEAVSLLLLAAVIGSLVLVRPR